MDKKSFLPLNLMQVFCGGHGSMVFIDGFSSFAGMGEIPGCSIGAPDVESGSLKANNTGKELWFQSEYVKNAQNVVCQLRRYDEKAQKWTLVEEECKLLDLFPESTTLVITTGGDSLRRFAPVFTKKADLNTYLECLNKFYSMWEYMGGSFPSFHWYSDMKELAEFLYEANKED